MAKEVVLITGGSGFFGTHITRCLEQMGKYEVVSVGRQQGDLRDSAAAYRLIHETRPKYLINVAALSGGINWNQLNRDRIFYDNTIMTCNLLSASASHEGVQKIVSVISSCAYPDIDRVIVEEDFWNGLPHPSIRTFGMQKRNMAAYMMTLQEQYPHKTFICPVVNNLYGPNDTFDIKRTKVVGATINRLLTAKFTGETPKFFGTGAPLRQFTYVWDAAVQIARLLGSELKPSIINITTPIENTIKELVETAAKLIGYDGEIEWGNSTQDGQMRKCMSGGMWENIVGEYKWTTLEDGLRKTINWYRSENNA